MAARETASVTGAAGKLAVLGLLKRNGEGLYGHDSNCENGENPHNVIEISKQIMNFILWNMVILCSGIFINQKSWQNKHEQYIQGDMKIFASYPKFDFFYKLNNFRGDMTVSLEKQGELRFGGNENNPSAGHHAHGVPDGKL